MEAELKSNNNSNVNDSHHTARATGVRILREKKKPYRQNVIDWGSNDYSLLHVFAEAVLPADLHHGFNPVAHGAV